MIYEDQLQKNTFYWIYAINRTIINNLLKIPINRTQRYVVYFNEKDFLCTFEEDSLPTNFWTILFSVFYLFCF